MPSQIYLACIVENWQEEQAYKKIGAMAIKEFAKQKDILRRRELGYIKFKKRWISYEIRIIR